MTLKSEIVEVSCIFFVFSDLSGVKIDAKNGDITGNFKVFVLGVGCWGRVVGGGWFGR